MPHLTAPRSLLAALELLALAGCQTTTVPRSDCAAPRRPATDFGPPAALSTTASVAVELSGRYVAERVRRALEGALPESATEEQIALPPGAPGSILQNGVLVKDVRLSEEQAGADRLHLLTIRIAPWIRHDEPDPQAAGRVRLSRTEVQRYYALRLRLRPRLAAAAGGGTAAIVPLELDELRDVSNGETVACTTAPDTRNPSYDVVTRQVHQGVLDALYGTEAREGAAPLALPGGKVAELVGGIAGAPAQLTGIALGTDQDLKIGFLTDQGTPRPFDATTGLSRYPQADWGLIIDPSFITAAIVRKVRAVADSQRPPVTVQRVDVTYEKAATTTGRENLISVTAPATANVLNCTVPLSIRADIFPAIRWNAQGVAALVAPAKQLVTPRIQGCILLEAASLLMSLRGQAQATVVCSPGPCTAPAPAATCPQMATVQFDAAPGDVFYGTELDTDGTFYIAGRSTLIDAALAARGAAPRPPVPSC